MESLNKNIQNLHIDQKQADYVNFAQYFPETHKDLLELKQFLDTK